MNQQVLSEMRQTRKRRTCFTNSVQPLALIRGVCEQPTAERIQDDTSHRSKESQGGKLAGKYAAFLSNNARSWESIVQLRKCESASRFARELIRKPSSHVEDETDV
eukprot:2079954-Rhodomonas_salina.1